jgi:uncharacterized membrane protein YbhN (UPF0104 family)
VKRLKSTIFFLIKLAISVSLFGYFISFIEPADISRRLDWPLALAFVIGCLLLLSTALFAGLRWRLILRETAQTVPTGMAFKSVLIGYFFDQFLPATIGGDGMRIWLFRKTGVSFALAAKSIVSDRIVGLISLLLFSALSLPFLGRVTDDATLASGLVLLIGLGLAFVLALMAVQLLPHAWRRHAFLTWMAELSSLTTIALVQPTLAGKTIGLSFLSLGALVGVYYAIAHAMQLDVSLLDLIVLIPPVVLLSAVPISFAGWGVREGIMVFALGKLGIDASDAVILSAGFGIAYAIAALGGGGFWFLETVVRKDRSAAQGPGH